MAAYGTLYQLKWAMQKETSDTDDDALLQRILDAASRKIDRFCNRPDGFVADSDAEPRTYRGSGRTYQLIDECVAIEQVAVKESPSDVVYAAWRTPNTGSLAANLTVAASGSFTADAAGLYEANDIINLNDGVNEAWLEVAADSGAGVYQYILNIGTVGDVFLSGLRIGSMGDWIPFSGDPDEPDFNSLPYDSLLVDPNGDESWFVSGRDWERRIWRTGRRGSRLLGSVPTVRITARWGYAIEVPEDVAEACVMQAARWYKRLQGAMADSLASTDLGQLMYVQKLDPDVAGILLDGRYVRPAAGR